MATIDQLARIASNRSGAVTDVETRLEGATDPITINAAHISAGVSNVPANMFPAALQRTSSLAADVAALSTSFTLNGGAIDVAQQVINLSSIHNFADTASRNAGFPQLGGSQTAPSIVWHQGDIALVGSSVNTRTAYVYIGTDQTTAAASVDADWTELALPPTSTINITRDSAIATVALTGGAAAANLTASVSDFGAGVPASFIANAAIAPAFFLDGLKLSPADVAFSNNNQTVTVAVTGTQRMRIAGEDPQNTVQLQLEWEYITAS